MTEAPHFAVSKKLRQDIGLRMGLAAAGLKLDEIESLLDRYWKLETLDAASDEIEAILSKYRESPAREEFLVKIGIYLRSSLRQLLHCENYAGDDLDFYFGEILWVADDEKWDASIVSHRGLREAEA